MFSCIVLSGGNKCTMKSRKNFIVNVYLCSINKIRNNTCTAQQHMHDLITTPINNYKNLTKYVIKHTLS